MRGLIYVAAAGALLAATSANAAVSLSFTGVTDASVSVWQPANPPGQPNPYIQTTDFPQGGVGVWTTPLNNGKRNPPTVNYGASTQADITLKNKSASFTSGVAARGPTPTDDLPNGTAASSTTGIDAVLTNTGAKPVTVNSIESTIIQAGMGFMVQKTSGTAVGNNVFTGYGADNKGSFGDLNVGGALNGQTIATASFSFNIYGADYASASDVPPLYTLSGLVSLSFDDAGNIVETSDVTAAQDILNNFVPIYQDVDGEGHPLPLSNADNIAGYEWDATDISVALNTILGAGQSTDLFYRATSSVTISAPCVSAKECLVAYSGFGDPVGRGGGVSDFALDALNSNNNSGGCPDPTSVADINQICFSPQTIKPFSSVDFTRGAVPEPATWMSMILGFGLAGAALRRRGVVSYS